jgi:ADP-ribose pyrophosphatase YjhB (NUDIX family)
VSETDGPKHSVSVSAVIFDDEGRALAIRRRDNGEWEPPGGVLELSESVTAGLAREVAEETGLRVEAETLTGVYKNIARGIVALVFRCRVVGGTPTTSEEAAEIAWLTLAETRERMSEAYAVRVVDAMSGGPTPVRLHDGRHLVTPTP